MVSQPDGTVRTKNALGYASPLTIGGSGPPIAAYFMLRHHGKITGFKPFIKEAFAVKQPPIAYIIVFIFTAAYFGIPALLGGSLPISLYIRPYCSFRLWSSEVGWKNWDGVIFCNRCLRRKLDLLRQSLLRLWSGLCGISRYFLFKEPANITGISDCSPFLLLECRLPWQSSIDWAKVFGYVFCFTAWSMLFQPHGLWTNASLLNSQPPLE